MRTGSGGYRRDPQSWVTKIFATLIAPDARSTSTSATAPSPSYTSRGQRAVVPSRATAAAGALRDGKFSSQPNNLTFGIGKTAAAAGRLSAST